MWPFTNFDWPFESNVTQLIYLNDINVTWGQHALNSQNAWDAWHVMTFLGRICRKVPAFDHLRTEVEFLRCLRSLYEAEPSLLPEMPQKAMKTKISETCLSKCEVMDKIWIKHDWTLSHIWIGGFKGWWLFSLGSFPNSSKWIRVLYSVSRIGWLVCWLFHYFLNVSFWWAVVRRRLVSSNSTWADMVAGPALVHIALRWKKKNKKKLKTMN